MQDDTKLSVNFLRGWRYGTNNFRAQNIHSYRLADSMRKLSREQLRKQYFGLPHWRYPRVCVRACMRTREREEVNEKKAKKSENVHVYESEKRRMLFNRISIYMCIKREGEGEKKRCISHEGKCARATKFSFWTSNLRWPLPCGHQDHIII